MGTNITGIGNANAIGFKSRVTGGAYFPPELKDALVGVWSAYGKSNDSTDRNIIKNKIKDRGGDFVISNAAFKLNSGFGKYEVDFTSWIQTDGVIASSDKVQNSIIGRFLYFNTVNKKEDVPSFKVNITLGQQSKLQYNYIKEDGTTTYIVYSESGIYTIPASYFSKYTGGNAWFGFYQIEGTSIIEQIPSFEGAFVTDGIDDLITSTKTVQEMLGGSNEITVVSMIHLVQTPAASSEKAYTNQIRTGQNYLRNYVTDNGKTGIYGYTCKGNNVSVINNILGDKNDYTVENKSWNNLAKFSVIGYEDNGTINELDQVAWYWTFIANRVLTEDEINLVIEKYNLDRPGEIVKPQVYYNIKKQKISNDNHSAFDDKLIDYSGNGYDAKLYNFGWKEDSGIGKYGTDFTSWLKSIKITSLDSESFSFISDVNWTLLYYKSNIGKDMPSFKVKIKLDGDGAIYYNYITQEGILTNVSIKTEEFETPISYNTKYTGETPVNVGFTMGVRSGECSGTITQIPEYKDALIFDGIDDYGKVTGLPILKDYTFLVDRQIINIGDVQRIVASKSESATDTAKQGAFLFEYLSKNSISTWSYYENNPLVANADFNRDISYQSKYIYNGKELTIGGAGDSDKLWLGTIRDNDSRFFNGAIYLLMLFPYSMSEFLIERQIEKVKGGTLYPNQVEFRPIIPEDENITKIDYFVVNSGTWTVIKPGDYVDVGARIVLNVYTKLPYKIAGASSTAFTGMTVGPSTALNIWDVKGYIKDKTPQKIKLTLAVNEDIIQWNPTISANIPDSYDAVTEWFANGWETKIAVGDWIKKSDRLFFKLKLKEPLHEIGKVTFGGSECQATKASNWSESNNLWEIVTYSSVGDLSQVFNVQVDEYIRYEDIVQPYPILLRFNDENGNGVSWGGKFRVGSTITRIGSIADPESNLLNGLYSISGLSLNGKAVTSSTSIVEKQMVFKTTATYLLDNNEPKCILSPRLLRIPNSSYKILGHIPDISGHGNNGVIHNSAYAEGSGVNEDGSYQFDGVDDFVTIPTIVGGKQVLMKVNWQNKTGLLYDQRKNGSSIDAFAILNVNSNNSIAYNSRNTDGETYIDGILNKNIVCPQLYKITHSITIINQLANKEEVISPTIGSDTTHKAYFSQMALYDFMLFDDISIDDKIKELNEYIGLSGNIFEFNPPTFTIDLPMAIKNIKVYQGGNEISPGYLYPNKDTEFEVYVSLNDGKYAVDTITVDGVEITKDRVVGEYNIFKFTLNGSSEQKITIHSYEYIMYEDINQPYPVIFKVKDRTTNQIYSWGDRIKIGSSIQLIHGENPNLLPELYSIISYTYEGNSYSYNQLTNLVITVTKTISVSCQKTWKLGNNEPKCILSPKRLKLANSSYKYLGYIPDISGNGNNGAFTNFAFSGMSGADGYLFDFYTVISLVRKVSVTDDTIVVSRDSTSDQTWALNLLKQSGQFDLYVNWEDNSTRLLVWAKGGTIVSQYALSKGWNSIPAVLEDYDYIYLSYVSPSVLGQTVIKQKAKYEGSICFDGIDDYVDIPSLSIGGKQVLMKTNWLKSPTLLYDQRASGSFAILTTKEDDATNPRIAYQARNQDGKTYIDGIENNYIETYSLKGITHNITVTNPSAGSGVVPVIGANTGKSSGFAKMALYDFMLFDEVSTNEEIKQLNDIVGIEGGYVQKPPYYWDAYGKTNSDADRDTIQQRGIAVGDYDLINNNFAYEGMSGYNGYPAVFGANKTYANLVPNDGNFILTSSHNIINVTKFDTSYGLLYSHIKLDGKLTSRNIDYPSYKIKVTGLGENFGLHYSYLKNPSDANLSAFGIGTDGTYTIPKSFASDGSLINNNVWIGFIFTGTAPESCNVTIEVLPEYENGLVYDGVDDYSENTSIPVFTDYTYIFKRTLLNKKYNSASAFKGNNKQAGGGAFICDYNSVEPDLRIQGYSFGAGLYVNSLNTDNVIYGARDSVNGQTITSGNNADTEGLTIGKWRAYKQMIFYKLMLYPRTTDMLTINMIKNMMAEDGIIDIQGKLFTDKFTGDFNLDFNKDFLIGN